jgi:hypothetical protein
MTLSLLRKLIREEIGRDLKSPRPDTMNWRDFPGVHVMITADPVNGCYNARVTVKDREDLSTPNRRFKSENDASFWARDKAERAYRALLGTEVKNDEKPIISLDR